MIAYDTRPRNRYANSVPPCRVLLPEQPVVGCGAMAQLVARLHGMQKVRGSNPLSSTAFFENSFEWIVTNIVTISGRVFWFYASSSGSLKPLSMTVASPASELLTACGYGTSTRRELAKASHAVFRPTSRRTALRENAVSRSDCLERMITIAH